MSVIGKNKIFRKGLAVVLVFAMIFGCMTGGNVHNTEAAETDGHNYDQNGFCTDTGCTQPYQKPEGMGTEDSPYMIENGGQLYYFAGIVNGDSRICTGGVKKDSGARACLVDDIILNEGTVNGVNNNLREWTPIVEYTGTFEGKNYTVSGLYIYKTDASDAGLFEELNGVCNRVGLVNSYIYSSNGNCIGSFAAQLGGTIANCYSTACLATGNAQHAGGLAGCSTGDSGVIKNSYFAGTASGSFNGQDKVFGGIIGYDEYDTKSGIYSYNGSCQNCYYLASDVVTLVNKGSEAKEETQFASGQVTYELNSNAGERIYGQQLEGEGVSDEEVQTMPVLNGMSVSRKFTALCPGCQPIDAGYINEEEDWTEYTYPEHHYADNSSVCLECNQQNDEISSCNYVNGICTDEGCTQPYQKCPGNGREGDEYLISNAGQLFYFAEIVNGNIIVENEGKMEGIYSHAKLMDDIKLNDGTVNGVSNSLRQWTVIEQFMGCFDGNNHTISGLYINEADNAAALFNHMNGSCKNVGIINSYIRGEGECVASIAARLMGSVENCHSNACLESTQGIYVGGLVGTCVDSAACIKNSYFSGTVQGSFDKDSVFCGITGWHEYDAENLTGIICEICQNCYILSGIGNKLQQVAERTEAQFASGQVACELNEGQEQKVFGQTLSGEGVAEKDVQAYPVLGGTPVYEMMKKRCPGIDDTHISVVRRLGYTNDKDKAYQYEYSNHDYDTDNDGEDDSYICQVCGKAKEHKHEYVDGICKYCYGILQPAGDGTSENPYQISNEDELKWLAENLNEANKNGDSLPFNAELTTNLYMNSNGVTAGSVDAYRWNIIDKYPKNMVFDGKGHTIYGMCYEGSGNCGFILDNCGTVCNVTFAGVSVKCSESFEVKYFGTVCSRNNGTIDNVIVRGNMDIEYFYCGGICGTNAGVIKNCINYSDITVQDKSGLGGIAAFCDGKIENCINYGTIKGEQCDYVGGITGAVDNGTISCCANEGTIISKRCAGGISGIVSYGKIEKCFNTGNITAYEQNAGGIVGLTGREAGLNICSNTGRIQTTIQCPHMLAGGIIGYEEWPCTVEQCFYSLSSIGTGIGFSCEDCDAYDNTGAIYRSMEDGIEGKEDEAFTDGEIIWRMNHAAEETWLYETNAGKAVIDCHHETGYKVVRTTVYGCSGAKKPLSEEFSHGEEDSTTYRYKSHNYDVTTMKCKECGKIYPHVCIYGEDGYCRMCSGLKKPQGDGTEESPYEISNPGELYWFAAVVNGDGDVCKDGIKKNTNACAVLTEDIVLNENVLSGNAVGASVWTPIGMVFDYKGSERSENAYKGCFDGQGHTITGLYIKESAKNSDGLFGTVERSGVIKNVNLARVYIAESSTYAGGICNRLYGTVEGCAVSGYIAARKNAGGIVGVMMESGTIYGCCNTAQVRAQYPGGIVSGLYGSSSVTGCYSTGVVTGTKAEIGITQKNGIVGDWNTEAAEISGCFYLDEENGDAAGEYGKPASEEEFASGKIAYQMNRMLEKSGFDGKYGQILTGEQVQNLPVWNEKIKVYSAGVVTCPGVEAGNGESWSNQSDEVSYLHPEHAFDNGGYVCTFCGAVKEHTCVYVDGWCKYCGEMSKPSGDGTKESPYQISTAAELFWFRDMVSGDLNGEKANPAACAVLLADIDLQSGPKSAGAAETYWTPVGISKKSGRTREYKGSFDGQGHRITGLKEEAKEYSEQNIGVFGTIGENGIVQNLHVVEAEISLMSDASMRLEIDEEINLGVFCKENNGTVSGCSVETDFSVTNKYMLYNLAGFVGMNMGTIVNSSIAGDIRVVNISDSYVLHNVAGFCGRNKGTLEKCCNKAEVQGNDLTVGICYWNQGTIEKCWNEGDVFSKIDNSVGICSQNDGIIRNSWNEAEIRSSVFSSAGIGICKYNSGTMEYCFNVGKVAYGLFMYNQSAGRVFTCYNMNGTCDMVYAENAGLLGRTESRDAGEFENGLVTYLLNRAQGRDIFGQRLQIWDESGEPVLSPEVVDTYPVLDGRTVYPAGSYICPGAEDNDLLTVVSGCSNTVQNMTYAYPEHYYYMDSEGTVESAFCYYCKHAQEAHTCTYENGVCTQCGWFEVPDGDGSKEHPYEISNAGQLCYFAHVVEGRCIDGETVIGNAKACAVLTADIDLADLPQLPEGTVLTVSDKVLKWTAIGLNKGVIYDGTFDGQGHFIHGMQSREEKIAALFARTGKNAVVKNVMLSACDVNANQAAGISIINEGLVENCLVNGWIESFMSFGAGVSSEEGSIYSWLFKELYDSMMWKQCVSAGISAVNKGIIRNCLVNGVVAGANETGFICGDNTDGTVENSYYCNTADEQDNAYLSETNLFMGKGMGTKDKDGQTSVVTEGDLNSGKVAWMLDTNNSFEGNKGIWKQDLDNDMPTVAREGAVTLYYLFEQKLDGTTLEYYLPADSDITEYLQNTEGAKWICNGGIGTIDDGTVFMETTMKYSTICIKEGKLPTGVIAVGKKNWTEFMESDGYTVRLLRGTTLNVMADSKETKIAYYIHKAASATESTLTVEDLATKSFVPLETTDNLVLNEKGYIVVYVRMISAEGLVDYICTEGLLVENPYLLSITAPKAITGLANGTEKDAASLGLPAAVTITTEDESITSAAVTWDLDNLVSGSYDSSVTTQQTFTVGGTVRLPDDINANGISLTVQVTVTVDAKKTVTPDDPDDPTPGTPSDPDDPTPGTPSDPDDPTPGTPSDPDDPTPGTPSDPDDPTPGTPDDPDDPTPGTPSDPDDPTPGTPSDPDDPTPGTPSDPDDPTPGTPDDPDDPTPGEPTGSPVDPSTGGAVTTGDVNGDGEIKLNDAQLALRAALLLDELLERVQLAADVNGDGKVKLDDAQQILRRALLLISEFKKVN